MSKNLHEQIINKTALLYRNENTYPPEQKERIQHLLLSVNNILDVALTHANVSPSVHIISVWFAVVVVVVVVVAIVL